MPYDLILSSMSFLNPSVAARLKREDAALLKFVADPPTVTMHRLKGLTTG
jgi:predicted AlkP superfamily pyrophosphatase or phosphodiesterase